MSKTSPLIVGAFDSERRFLEIIASWVMTLVFAGLISAAVCSFAVGAKYPVVGPEAIVAQNGSVIEGGYVPELDDE
jgi:hypothetical protein